MGIRGGKFTGRLSKSQLALDKMDRDERRKNALRQRVELGKVYKKRKSKERSQ